MAKRKSPFTDWIFLEWNELVLDNGAKLSHEERTRRCHDLLGKLYMDGKWIVGIWDAEAPAVLAATLAMEAGDFLAARDFCRQLMAHPDFGQDDVFREYTVSLEAVCDYLCGNMNAACERLVTDVRVRRHPPHVARGSIGRLLEHIGPQVPVDPELVQVCVELILAYPNKKRLAKRATMAKTNQDLLDAIDGTYDRPKLDSS
jgi:hypothetical protein